MATLTQYRINYKAEFDTSIENALSETKDDLASVSINGINPALTAGELAGALEAAHALASLTEHYKPARMRCTVIYDVMPQIEADKAAEYLAAENDWKASHQ